MASIESLSFPNKSHRKKVLLPKHSIELAEFFGIMMGDGGINNPWQANISLNSVVDAVDCGYVCSLIEGLFGISPALVRSKTRKCVRVQISSTTLVDFLVSEGLPRGDKLKNGLSIPSWILENKEYRVACVRGLMDTDGCLYIHIHSAAGKEYKNIGLCYSSHAPALIQQVAAIFEEFGIMPHISKNGRCIYLYSARAVHRYLDVFGTSNERISSKYREWRRG